MNSILPKTSQGYYFERNGIRRSSAVSVISANYSVRNTYAETKAYTHPFWVIDYSYVNCGLCRVGKRRSTWIKRTAGCAHLYRPGTPYWEDYSNVSLPAESSFITFYGGEMLDLEKHVDNGEGFGRFFDKTGELGGILADTALQASRGGEDSYWLVMSKLYAVVDMLHKARPGGTGSDMLIAGTDKSDLHDRDHVFVENVRKYLKEHAGKTVSIADLAGQLNASPSTISHKYRVLTGESPMKTFNTFRINTVKNMLVKGETMKYIASQTGFCDEFHLSKVFKKVVGSSPSAYIKSLIKP